MEAEQQRHKQNFGEFRPAYTIQFFGYRNSGGSGSVSGIGPEIKRNSLLNRKYLFKITTHHDAQNHIDLLDQSLLICGDYTIIRLHSVTTIRLRQMT